MKVNSELPAGSSEDNGGRKAEGKDNGQDRIPPPEEELKDLLKKTPDDLNLDDDQDLKAND